MLTKTVIVTGSADNIGKAIAKKFAAAGANIVVNARNNVEGGEKVAAELREDGVKSIFVQADVSRPQQAATLIKRAQAEFGTVDVLINNAGSFEERSFATSDREHWMRMFDSNLFSAVNCSLEAAKVMLPGSTILNMASIRGIDRGGRPGGIAYSAAKAAVINFTKTLAQELAPNINVNAVAPGFTRTTAFDGEISPRKLCNRFLTTLSCSSVG